MFCCWVARIEWFSIVKQTTVKTQRSHHTQELISHMLSFPVFLQPSTELCIYPSDKTPSFDRLCWGFFFSSRSAKTFVIHHVEMQLNHSKFLFTKAASIHKTSHEHFGRFECICWWLPFLETDISAVSRDLLQSNFWTIPLPPTLGWMETGPGRKTEPTRPGPSQSKVCRREERHLPPV